MLKQLFKRITTVAALSVAGLTGSDFAVAQIGESKAVWGLTTGDTLTVNVVIVKQTEVIVLDQSPTISETTDRFQIQYQVSGSSPAGDIMVAAKLRRTVRETGETTPEVLQVAAGSARALDDLALNLELDSDGVVTSISTTDRDAIVAIFSGLDPSASRLLRNACPDSVIAGWFARPFWVAHDRESLQEGVSWSRTEEIAIGPFGTMRCDADLELANAEELAGSVEISGKGRFVPLVLPSDARAFGVLPLTDVTAELDEFSGNARMYLSPSETEGTPKPGNRPQFESLNVTLRFHGTATIPVKKEIALTDERPETVSYRQTQVQSWFLQDFSYGRREFFSNEPVPREPK